MSFVLAATYPNEADNFSVHYAAGLAAGLQLPLRIICPYTVPLAVGEMPMPLLPVEEVRDAAQARVESLKSDFQRQYPNLRVSGDLVYGTLADVVNEAARSGLERAALSVVPNGAGGDADSWLGSEVASLLRESRASLLAVPAGVPFRTPRHVCIACDFKGVQEGLPLLNLLRLKTALGFRLTVLHVLQSGDAPIQFERSMLQNQLVGTASSFSEITANDGVDKAIAGFVSGQAVDWLAVAPHHYGFWEGLFHRSHTVRLLEGTKVPIFSLRD